MLNKDPVYLMYQFLFQRGFLFSLFAFIFYNEAIEKAHNLHREEIYFKTWSRVEYAQYPASRLAKQKPTVRRVRVEYRQLKTEAVVITVDSKHRTYTSQDCPCSNHVL